MHDTFTGLIGTICMFPLRAIIRACVLLRIHPTSSPSSVCSSTSARPGRWPRGASCTAGAIMIAANIFDFIDGKVAREMGMESAFGGFWDSVMDRFSDLALFLGLVYLYSSVHRTDYVVITVMAMIFTVLTSYARARAESVVAQCKVGFMERPERIVLFMIGAFTNRMAGVLWVILVLSILTVADRIFYTLARARAGQGAGARPGMTPADRRRPPAPQGDRRRRHQPAAAAARDLAHALLDLRAGHLAIRPDGHRHPGVRVADAADLDRRSARVGARARSAGWPPGCAADTDRRRPSSVLGTTPMVVSPQHAVAILLAAIGAGFLLANLRIGYQLLRFARLQSSALLTWPGRTRTYPRLALVMGIVLAFVIAVKLVVLHRLDVFGESMMLLYYVHLVPLDERIGRGFYQDGALARQRLPALRRDRRPDLARDAGADAGGATRA